MTDDADSELNILIRPRSRTAYKNDSNSFNGWWKKDHSIGSVSVNFQQLRLLNHSIMSEHLAAKPSDNGNCLFFDVHFNREDDFWPMWEQLEAMKRGLTDPVCDCS